MRTPLFSWLFLIPIYFVSLSGHTFVVSSQCSGDDEQLLLLHLKNSLEFDLASSTKLVKWNQGSDYCSWEGVSCKEGCVTHLDLSSESISGGLDNSSTLFSLQYLENLNLAYNRFNYIQIPSKLGKLTSLSSLNLSHAGFAGQIPIEISHLTRLVILHFSTFYFDEPPSLKLENPNLSLLIGNLSELIELHLDGVNISAQRNDWCQAISASLPNLRVLSLSGCALSGPIHSSLLNLHSVSVIRIENNNLSTPVPEFFSNFKNLTSLRLGNSGLYGTFPKKIFQVPTLQTIHLWGNPELQGSLPDFPKNGSLRSLVLSGSNFSGLFPNSIGDLKMLSTIDIFSCNFSGSIPRSMANLTQLVYLDMSWNRFTGPIPLFSMAKNLTLINLSFNHLTGQINSNQLENLTNMVTLDLRSNLLNGSIPLSLFSHPMLEKLLLSSNQLSGQLPDFTNISSYFLGTLELSSNNLEGPIPTSIFNLRGLNILSLSSNNFSGPFLLNDLQQLRNLSNLDLSHNSLSICYDDTNSSYPSFPQLTTLLLASGKLRTFPDFLRNQSALVSLDLSENQIHGRIPNWIWSFSNLHQLNLSCNSLDTLEGPMLNLTSPTSVLDLHSNQLQGEIPVFPLLPSYIDYSRNNFSSSIPTDISLPWTFFFSLSSNNLQGMIPESICNAQLNVLDLSNNHFSGMIPQCLVGMSDILAVLNLGRNNLTGSISDKFLGNCSLKTLDLNQNHIEGQFPESIGQCTMLEVLNLGNNQITGTFPSLLQNIPTLRVLVLRSNKFYGRIGCPKTSGTWPMLQIIDLAHNNFGGEIPGRCLRAWQAMRADEGDAVPVLSHLQFKVLRYSQLYYEDTITVTSKGLKMELVKILTIFTSIDLSSNKFNGSVPKEMGQLKSLYVLNLSSNDLNGEIPSSFGNLQHVESLDLSNNSLSGQIPQQLAKLTFLSFLNLSNNQLVGRIPTGTQFSTFPVTSFIGNKGLWGPPLTVDNETGSMSPPTLKGSHPNSGHHENIDWDFVTAEIGFIVGFGSVIGSLMFCKRWRDWYYNSVEIHIILKIFPHLSKRSGDQGRHVYRNRRWRN